MKRRDGAIEGTADELETLKADISERENALDEKKEFLLNEEGCFVYFVIRTYQFVRLCILLVVPQKTLK